MADNEKSEFWGLFLPQEVRDKLEGEKTEAENKLTAENVRFERLRLWLNLAKWLIGSVAITLIVFSFNWILKERIQGLDEIKEYEKHIELITADGSIEKRRLLAQFFSNVTASSTLRQGWKDYSSQVQKDYESYKIEQENLKLEKIAAANNLDPVEKEKQLKIVREKLNQLKAETTLSPSQVSSQIIKPENNGKNSSNVIYFQITDENLREFSESLVKKIRELGYKADGTELKDVELKQNQIRYFNQSDSKLATNLQTDLLQLGLKCEIKDLTALGKNIKNGQIEVWIAQK